MIKGILTILSSKTAKPRPIFSTNILYICLQCFSKSSLAGLSLLKFSLVFVHLTMKQKVVIKISMNDAKSRTRAMKIAVSTPGVVSAELQGADKNQIVVTGERIDSTSLTMSIRKKVGFAELVSVTAITEKKDEKKVEKKEEKKDVLAHPIVWNPYHHAAAPQICFYEVPYHNHDPCTIM